jgi:hypothetical protein
LALVSFAKSCSSFLKLERLCKKDVLLIFAQIWSLLVIHYSAFNRM